MPGSTSMSGTMAGAFSSRILEELPQVRGEVGHALPHVRGEHVVRGHTGQRERGRRAQTLLHARVQLDQVVPHGLDHIDVHTQGLPFMWLPIGHTSKHI